MPIPVGYTGRGTLLYYSTDGVTFTSLGQLQQFEHAGSKQTMVDQTNILTPADRTQPLSVRVDAGEIDASGVLNPQDDTYAALQGFHANQTLVTWKVQFIEGSAFTFEAYVSQFKAFSAKWNKLLAFTSKLRLTGPLTPALL
jgi:hypothetical protein